MPRLQNSYLIAALLILAIVVWMATGVFEYEHPDAVQRPATAGPTQAVLVEAAFSRASSVPLFIVAHGTVFAHRRAVVKAETAGRVIEILVREGQSVGRARILVRLSLEARLAELNNAQAQLDKLEQDLENARRLARTGVVPQQRLRELQAQIAAAKADVARIEEAIEDTSVEAPFAGIVNEVSVEPGEYVSVGAALATLIDNDPLKVEVQVAQQALERVERTGEATVRFATGRTARGRICFISAAAADPQTRTLAVEVRVANPGSRTPSQISAEVELPTGRVDAHKISPAVLSLGAGGKLGIKTIAGGQRVEFRPVEIVRSETDGVWVTGLPEEVRLITTGQGFVQAGDVVRVAPADASSERLPSMAGGDEPGGGRGVSSSSEFAAAAPAPACNAAGEENQPADQASEVGRVEARP